MVDRIGIRRNSKKKKILKEIAESHDYPRPEGTQHIKNIYRNIYSKKREKEISTNPPRKIV